MVVEISSFRDFATRDTEHDRTSSVPAGGWLVF